MLKNIFVIIFLELFKIMFEMGYGDELVFVDGNFFVVSYVRCFICCDVLGIVELLEVILRLYLFDMYVEWFVVVM